MAIGAVRLHSEPKSVVRVRANTAEETKKQGTPKVFEGETPEIMLFQKKDEFVRTAPKITEVSKPVAEQAKVATASVNKPLFDFQFQSPTDRATAYNSGSIWAGLATSSGLRASESGSNTGDKKDGKNTFISAQKTLADLRLGKFEENNTRNIFCGVC